MVWVCFSVPYSICLIYSTDLLGCLFYMCNLKRQIDREGQRSSIHWFISCNDQGWACLNSGAGSSLWVFQVDAGAQGLELSPDASTGHKESWIRSETAGTWTSTFVGCWRLRQRLNVLWHSARSLSCLYYCKFVGSLEAKLCLFSSCVL